jgi:hypothetical protein
MTLVAAKLQRPRRAAPRVGPESEADEPSSPAPSSPASWSPSPHIPPDGRGSATATKTASNIGTEAPEVRPVGFAQPIVHPGSRRSR